MSSENILSYICIRILPYIFNLLVCKFIFYHGKYILLYTNILEHNILIKEYFRPLIILSLKIMFRIERVTKQNFYLLLKK